MIDVNVLAVCVSAHVSVVVDSWNPLDLVAALEEPQNLATSLEPAFRIELAKAGIDPAALNAQVRQEPFVHLRAIFDPTGLPDTPIDWLPLPVTKATLVARVAVLLISLVCGMETVSYGSENDGALFVNLVTLPGDGALADKSKAAMQGHTDAATFPFRGTFDPDEPRIAPSPDVVYLAAMRNPDAIPTKVVPLERALQTLPQEHVTVLKESRLTLQAQRSFQRGTKAILGNVHQLDGTHVLYDSAEGTWVRYTHSQSMVYDGTDTAASDAKASFEVACARCTQEVVLEPGDLLIVNNRKALHGRAPVGTATGGTTRWLIRGYGLNTAGLEAQRRYPAPPYKLFP